MLHNSGPYGPSESSMNVGPPINANQSDPLNMSQTLSNINKLGQDKPQAASAHYSRSEYLPFNPNHISANSQLEHYLKYANNFNNAHFTGHNAVDALQNGRFPFNMAQSSAYNDFTSKVFQRSFPNSYEPDSHLPIGNYNLPTKAFKKQYPITEEVANYAQITPYNLDIKHNNESLTASEYIDKERRKKNLEKSFRHIDRIIQDDAASKRCAKDKTEERKEIECVTIKMEVPESCSEDENESTDPVNNTGPMDASTIGSNLVNRNVESTELLALVKVKKEVSDVRVKVEKVPWLDTEYNCPFLRDTSGVTKDSVDNLLVLDKDMSLNIAMDIVKNGQAHPMYSHFQCPHCDLIFSQPKRYLIHVKWHSFGLVYAKRLEQAEAKELKKAKKRGEVMGECAEGRWPCTACEKVFQRRSALKSHRLKAHNGGGERSCKICLVVLPDYKSYRDHHNAEHPSDNGYKCAHCDKVFKYKHTLVKHNATHYEKTHCCQICPKKFGSDQLLKQHYKTHERTDRGHTHHCSICGKGFYEGYTLRVHERTHSNEKPFHCTVCNSSYGTNSSLKRHMKVSHSNQKPFECSECHRCFATKNIRDGHVIRSHGDRENFKYDCKECGRKFLTAKNLRRHIFNRHPKSKDDKEKTSDSDDNSE